MTLERWLGSPWLLFPLVWLAFFWQLGDSPLYDLDEGAFSEATREMFERGNFIATYLNGQPRYDKPILIYWLQALATLPLGFNELALRLPSALAATLWVAALYRFGRRFLDPLGGAVAALLLTCSLMVLINARAATADALLNLLLCLSLLDIYRYYQTPNRRLVVRVWLWMALGLLTKGPVALLLPLLISGLFFTWQGRVRDWARALLDPWGWLLFLALTLPWLIAVALEPDYQFYAGFLFQHNLGRFTDTMEGHGGHLYYYLLAAPLILLPFTGWFLNLLPQVRTDLGDPLGRYLWIWFSVVLVIFSFSNTQLPHYMLYGLVPPVLLMARARERLTAWWLAYPAPILMLAALLALPGLVGWVAPQVAKPWVRELLAEAPAVFDWSYFLILGLALVAVLLVALLPRLPRWQGLCLAGVLVTWALNGAFRPAFFELYQGPIKEAGLLARQLDLPTVFYQVHFPSFSVYRHAVVPKREPKPGEVALLRADRLAALAASLPQARLETLYRRAGILLVRVDGASP